MMEPISLAKLVARSLDCIADADAAASARAARLVRPGELAELHRTISPAQRLFLEQTGFTGAAGELRLLAGDDGLESAVMGLGETTALHVAGALPALLPDGTVWRLECADADRADATLAFCLGAYAPTATRPATRKPVLLAPAPGMQVALTTAESCWMVRDLINLPANLLGPDELAEATLAVAAAFGVAGQVVRGAALKSEYPTVEAVGRGSARPPCVASFTWRGSSADDSAPLIALCGKGVCFDTGGYDLKPAAGMLRMKKDMGGAAIVLGVARCIMQADSPVRLTVRIGCVENAVTGDAMRPGDILQTRRGLSVEVGNTDAEGRLVLCDLLAEASDEDPALVIDCATLTGAARVALGPDLPVLMCNSDDLATKLLECGKSVHDPVWRLPLWAGYDPWLNSVSADLNNVASKPMAGAIVAGLFLQRFVKEGIPWAHFDVYAWNDQSRPGRPEGGEAQALRCIVATVGQYFGAG